MRYKRLIQSLAILAGIVALPPVFAASASVEVDQMEERQLARIRREILRAKIDGRHGKRAGHGEGVGECGSVSIGNVAADKRTVGQRNITVVVQGPIVNADVKCR
jgi:hypothetical protein